MGLPMNREPLFSVHNSLNGDFVIYLEERDANLDVVEDILAAVPLVQLKGIQSLILHDLKVARAMRSQPLTTKLELVK